MKSESIYITLITTINTINYLFTLYFSLKIYQYKMSSLENCTFTLLAS